MSGLYYAPTELEASLGMERQPESVTQGAGLQNLGPSAADIIGLQRDIQRQTLALAPPPAPLEMAGAAPTPSAFFSPSTGQMFAGGRTFNQRDVQSALAAAQQFTAAAGMRPPAEVQDWQPVSRNEFDAYINSLSQRRGTGELLARGARAAVGGIVGGVGRGIEMLGAPETGRTIAGAGEIITGQDEFDRQRSALISERSSIGANILDAAIESLPILLPTIAGGGVGALAAGAGLRALGAGAQAVGRATSIGGVGGATAVGFPYHLGSLYEQAQRARTPDGQKAYDETSPEVQREIFYGAVFNSVLDAIAPGVGGARLSSAMTNRLRQATDDAVAKQVQSRVTPAGTMTVEPSRTGRAMSIAGATIGGAVTEAATEATQTLVEQALFDPEFRRLLTINDWNVIAPFVVEKYGRSMLIGAGAGALLGGGFGGAIRAFETRNQTAEENQPRDILQGQGQPAGGTSPTVIEGKLAGAPDNTGRDLGRGPFAFPLAPGITVRQDQFGPAGREVFGPFGREQFGPPAPLQFGPAGPEVFGPPDRIGTRVGTEQFGPPAPLQFGPAGPEVFGPPDRIGTRVGTEQFGPPDRIGTTTRDEQFNLPPAPLQLGPAGPEVFGPPALETLGPPVPTTAERQAQQDVQTRARINANAPRPETLFSPADPGSIQRAMESFGLTVEEVLSLRDPGRAMDGVPISIRDVNETAALLSRPRMSGAPATRPLPTVSAPLAQAMQNAGLTIEDVMVVRNRLQSGPVTYQDVQAAARRKGVELPMRLRVEPQTVAPQTAQAEAAPALPTVVEPTPAPTPATKLKRGRTRAAETGQVGQGRLRKRQAADEGGAAPETGRGNRTLRRGAGAQAQAAQEVTPAPALAPAEEVAAPRPLEVAAAPVAAEAPVVTAEAPAVTVEAPVAAEAAPVVEPSAPSATPATEPGAQPKDDLEEAQSWAVIANTTGGRTRIEAIAALIGWSKDGTDKAKAFAKDYLENEVDPADLRLAKVIDARDRLGREAGDSVQQDNNLVELGSIIEQLNAGEQFTAAMRLQASKAWSQLRDSNPDYGTGKLADYIVGGPNFFNFGERDPQTGIRPVVSKKPGAFSLATWNTLTGTRNLDRSAVRPMAPGRARMLVQTFLSKLATKPKVTVVANQRELQRTNPALYAQANAARPQGDFATAAAAGYSFGDGNVIIFTDRIANEQHLRFVLAHETFGHFGMRGVMPGDRFDALMGSIYDTDPQAKAAADAAMEARGLSKPEAVEEYLSDYAALLTTSTVARVWNGIKNILSKLGVRFGDTATRYFLDQSRRYVREGRQGVAFDAEAVAQRLFAVETGNTGTGRYSPEAALAESTKAQLFRDHLATNFKSLDSVFKAITDAGTNLPESFDRFKAKFFSLFNFRAMDNPWLFELQKLINQMNTYAMSLKTNINEFLRPLYNMGTTAQENISQLMYEVRQAKTAEFKVKDLPKGPLFRVNDDGAVVPNTEVTDKLFEAGLLTQEQIQKGMKYKLTVEGTDKKPKATDQEIPARPKFTDEEYAAYVRTRRAVANVDLEVLGAMYEDMIRNREITNREISRLIKSKKGILEPKDKAFVRTLTDKYLAIQRADASSDDSGSPMLNPASIAQANKFLEAVNRAFIWRDTKNLDPAREEAVRAFFPEKTQADDFVAKLNDTRSRRGEITDTNKLQLQQTIQRLVITEGAYTKHEARVKKSIATGYLPVFRDGVYQVRLRAFSGDKVVEVKDTHKDLLTYAQFDTKTEAEAFAADYNKTLKDKSFSLLGRDDAGNYEPTNVKLVADVGVVMNTTMTDPEFDLDNFLYGLQVLGQNLDPKAMERLVIRATEHSSARRRALRFSQTPGYDTKSGVVAVSRHIEKQASAYARAKTRFAVRELMDMGNETSRALLEGDKANVEFLKAEYDRIHADPNSTTDAKRVIKSQRDRAVAMYKKTNPRPGVSLANKYYNEGAEAIAYLDGSKFVDESDFGSGPTAARARSYAAIYQLGMNISQGVMNLLSPETNWKPYMSSYNPRNGFGAGFNYFTVTAEYNRAFMKIGGPGIVNPAMNEANFYDAGDKPADKTLLKDWKPGIAQSEALQKKYGMTAEEARIMAREIREGKLIPAQTNALNATARGYSTNKWALKFVDVWMAPFNLPEQAARRSTFLSAYRLFYNRGIGAGMDAKKASDMAREEAIRSIDLTLGEYSMMNRPAFWRGGPQSFLYVYKAYPTTVIQTISRLSRPAQLSALAGIWLFAGLSGLPFAEDLEDLLDTFAQKFGMTNGSLRAALVRHIEDIAPGMSATLLRGPMSDILGIDIAAKTGLGSFVPGTEMFLAGADQTRAMMDVLGPVAGFFGDALGLATGLATYPFSSTKTLEDLARESPVTFLRALGDVYAYTSTGSIVDRRGYVVSQDMNAGVVLARLTGFYPQAAAAQYDAIRLAQRETDYQKQMTAAFRQAWIKASLRGDSDRASEIMDTVRSWHESTRGTALDIQPGRFMMGNVRALREAQLAASDRTLRASPQAAQESIRDLMDALTD
jgi:hypothetical protein